MMTADMGLMWQGSWAAVGKCQMAGICRWHQIEDFGDRKDIDKNGNGNVDAT